MPTELVERAQAGDEDAFTELATLAADRAYAVAYRVLGMPAAPRTRRSGRC